ncbi:MAG: N-acetylneuraminate synthase, partial [Armatimonadetes bacterium]|nr:N-acetylneuraminate synthase [Armatimonadota bacterium]
VSAVRGVEAALGDGRKRPRPCEVETAVVARRSLVAAVDIPRGTALTEAMIGARRPGTGLPPAMRPYLVGRTARRDIPAGTLLGLDMLA